MPTVSFHKIPAYIMIAMFFLPGASAQETRAVPVSVTIPDGTPVKLQLAESVSSTHSRTGDPLTFVVMKDVSIEGFTVIPAGTVANGTVSAVKGKRFLGMGGEISLKLDSIKLKNGGRVNLRAQLDVKGRSHTKIMAAAMIATGLIFLPAAPIFLLTRGHASTIVKSTEITAHIKGTTSLLSTRLMRSRNGSSELHEMMDNLPPRVFNGEGREGDMVNLVFVAQLGELQGAFERAGWVQTDKWNPIVIWHLLLHQTNYMQMPMTRFYLFGRMQDYSYALPDPEAIVSRRHHLRLWKTDYTADGTPIWVGAATHDVAIEIAKRGRLINHRIDPAVDTERDFIGANLADTSSVSHQEYLHFSQPVFQAQTVSGEAFHSDSRVLLLDLRPLGEDQFGVTSEPSSVAKATSLPKAVSTSILSPIETDTGRRERIRSSASDLRSVINADQSSQANPQAMR